MKLNRTGSNWTERERNKINENWDIIEGSYNDVVGQITDEVVGHLIDSARLDWKEPVDTVEDLPADAEVGETRMVREADPDGISYVYRYDGEKWEKIQAIDVTLVNEVDSRLTRQLADIAVNVKNFGALGNGSTDDTQAIQEAINYLTSEGGGTLFFPKGVYIVDFVFNIDVHIIVEGDGIGSSVIKVKEESKLFHNPTRTNNINDTSLNSLYRDYHAVFFINNTDFTIRNIELDGNGENQSEYVNGELWNYVSPSFKNGEADFYKYYHGIQVRLTDNTNKNITIEKCYIHHFNWNNIV